MTKYLKFSLREKTRQISARYLIYNSWMLWINEFFLQHWKLKIIARFCYFQLKRHFRISFNEPFPYSLWLQEVLGDSFWHERPFGLNAYCQSFPNWFPAFFKPLIPSLKRLKIAFPTLYWIMHLWSGSNHWWFLKKDSLNSVQVL